MRHTSLTGAWSGAYRYPRDAFPETVFNAQIDEMGGAFVGATQEPNLRRPFLGEVVTADIDGERRGDEVTFTKYMDGSGGMNHAIFYHGRVNAALTRIEGVWSIPGNWSGTFFMSRDDEDRNAEAETEAEIEHVRDARK